LPNFRLPGDIAASRRYFDPDVIDSPIDVLPDGTVPVPSDGPGLGVRIVETRLDQATVRRMEIAEP
jgi:L-alanine-DL-glutamate epimerase-like enolase superfamily enzyme